MICATTRCSQQQLSINSNTFRRNVPFFEKQIFWISVWDSQIIKSDDRPCNHCTPTLESSDYNGEQKKRNVCKLLGIVGKCGIKAGDTVDLPWSGLIIATRCGYISGVNLAEEGLLSGAEQGTTTSHIVAQSKCLYLTIFALFETYRPNRARLIGLSPSKACRSVSLKRQSASVYVMDNARSLCTSQTGPMIGIVFGLWPNPQRETNENLKQKISQFSLFDKSISSFVKLFVEPQIPS